MTKGVTSMADTKPIDLSGSEARQLYHGVEFALTSLRAVKKDGLPSFLTEADYNSREQKLKDLLKKMETFALTFPENQ